LEIGNFSDVLCANKPADESFYADSAAGRGFQPAIFCEELLRRCLGDDEVQQTLTPLRRKVDARLIKNLIDSGLTFSDLQKK